MDKNIEKLIRLSKENPRMEIITMVNWEVCCSDDYSWWLGMIQKVKKDFVWHDDEQVWLSKADIMDRLYDLMSDDIDRWPKGYEVTEEDAEEAFKALQNAGEVKEKIIIYISN